MELSQQSLNNLLESKKKSAICVAKSNGKVTITRRFEGDRGSKYVSKKENYNIFGFILMRKALNKGYNRILGTLYQEQKEEGILYGE